MTHNLLKDLDIWDKREVLMCMCESEASVYFIYFMWKLQLFCTFVHIYVQTYMLICFVFFYLFHILRWLLTNFGSVECNVCMYEYVCMYACMYIWFQLQKLSASSYWCFCISSLMLKKTEIFEENVDAYLIALNPEVEFQRTIFRHARPSTYCSTVKSRNVDAAKWELTNGVLWHRDRVVGL
jgi:hypothetical protein